MPNVKGGQTHDEWQAEVVELARILGWEHLHVRKSIAKGNNWRTTTNVKGWPDLFLWHRTRGFMAIEIKVGKDTATPEQTKVLDALAAAGARTIVAYPADFDTLVTMLRTGPTIT